MYTGYCVTTTVSKAAFIATSFMVIAFSKAELAKTDHLSYSRSIDEPSKDEAIIPASSLADNVVDSDEHHKIIILMPQLMHGHASSGSANVKKKHPKVHHHSKVIPVVHSGKVIHAHHHHGNADHKHSHSAKANHHHKHFGTGDHKHYHHGIGTVIHKNEAKSPHNHKQHHAVGPYAFPPQQSRNHRDEWRYSYLTPQRRRNLDASPINDRQDLFVPNTQLLHIRIPSSTNTKQAFVGPTEFAAADEPAIPAINSAYSNFGRLYSHLIADNGDETADDGLADGFIGDESSESVADVAVAVAAGPGPGPGNFERNIVYGGLDSDRRPSASVAASSYENFISANIGDQHHPALPLSSLSKTNIVAYSDNYRYQ